MSGTTKKKKMAHHHAPAGLRTRRVDECETLDEVFRDCLPAFGGAFLRRMYNILDRAIGLGFPLTLAISGPVTVSGQHLTWLIPLLETGWVAYLSTTDAVCYHDGHRSLDAHRQIRFMKSRFSATTARCATNSTIRVTDVAFDESVLLDQDKFLSAVLTRARVSEEDDRHRDALSAWRALRRAGAQDGRAARACSRPATAWQFRCLSARLPTAASF